ncbi:MAG: FUSC family protein, partial [Candidatus Eremiobacteraeota bacterium]|nr:FUSC family protein [Candidatus Eremiobacteraeota bacterium]
QTLADPQPFARRGDIAAFQSLLDETERIRASLGALARDRARSSDGGAVDAFLLASAALLDQLAAAFDAAREPIDPGGDWQKIIAAESRLESSAGADVHARSDAHALAGQLRSAWRIATYPADVPIKSESEPRVTVIFPSLEDTLETLRANLSLRTPYGRLAPRLAVTLAVATILGAELPGAHGYWIAMTSVILLRPDFSTTALRGVARVAGTLVGAILATTIAAHVRPGAETYVALSIFFAGLAYAVFNANYALFTVAITAYVGFLLALVGQTETSAVLDRVVATLVAGGLSGLAVLIWPTWEAGRVRSALAEWLDASRRYLRLVLEGYAAPERYDAQAIAKAQTAAWAQRSDAEASLDRMLGEPVRTHGIAEECALGVVAAGRRIGLVVLALNAHATRATRRERPELAAFADRLDDALRASIEALREARPPAPYGHLREAYRTLANSLERTDPDGPMLLAECDALVDATNTIAELLVRG